MVFEVGRLSRVPHAVLYRQFKTGWGVCSMPTVRDAEDWDEFVAEWITNTPEEEKVAGGVCVLVNVQSE